MKSQNTQTLNTNSTKKSRFFATACFCVLGFAAANTAFMKMAHAQGVTAGTTISNIVVVNYTVEGLAQ